MHVGDEVKGAADDDIVVRFDEDGKDGVRAGVEVWRSEVFEEIACAAIGIQLDQVAMDRRAAGEEASPDENFPVRFDGEDEDGGPTEYVWRCVKPAPDCPRTRPSNNDDCVLPMTCDYGDCVFEDGVTMRCYASRWTSHWPKWCCVI